MAWFYLIVAGLLETGWAAGLKLMSSRGSALLFVVTVAAMGGSLLALYVAMARLPLGVAYPIWTGIGSVGSVIVGILFFGQTIGPAGVAGVAFLLLGMALLGFDS